MEDSKILFSPVGNSDPATEKGNGPLLCICNDYLPDVVYLFMSSDIYKRHEKDNRYIKAISEVYKRLDKEQPQIEIIEFIGSPVDMNAIYQAMKEPLDAISNKYPDSQILLNVTSGTSQMSSTLALIDGEHKYKTTAIQVISPVPSAGEDKYRSEFLNVEDLGKSGSNQTKQIEHDAIGDLFIAKAFKECLVNYNYKTAHQIYLREFSYADDSICAKLNNLSQAMIYNAPGKDVLSKIKNHFAVEQARINTNDLASFTLHFTPLFTAVCNYLLKDFANDYSKAEDGNVVFDTEKILKNTELLIVLEIDPEKDKHIYNSHLVKLIKHYFASKDIVINIKDASNFERYYRNKIAHDINFVGISKNKAQNALDNLMNALGLSRDDLNYFDIENQKIIEQIS